MPLSSEDVESLIRKLAKEEEEVLEEHKEGGTNWQIMTR